MINFNVILLDMMSCLDNCQVKLKPLISKPYRDFLNGCLANIRETGYGNNLKILPRVLGPQWRQIQAQLIFRQKWVRLNNVLKIV